MKKSLCIPAAVFYYVVSFAFSNEIQVGTVLFTKTDLVKKCWSENDKALLRARLIMQDVLPDPNSIDFSKPETIVTLLDYFQSCYNIVKVSTYGKLQNLMLLALSDALGGYLRAYVLPFTRKAYYAGQIKYHEAKKLFQLQEDIKIFLNTNGFGWARPQKMCKYRLKTTALDINKPEGNFYCRHLYTIEKKMTLKESEFNEMSPDEIQGAIPEIQKVSYTDFHSGLEEMDKINKKINGITPSNTKFNRERKTIVLEKKKKKKSIGRDLWDLKFKPKNLTVFNQKISIEKRKRGSDLNPEAMEGIKNNKMIIPLPLLEDSDFPHTIAVPFKVHPLRNMQSRKSAYVLERYYITVIKCLISKNTLGRDIRRFNSQFHSWIVSQVYPHLEDEKWYPAFGGVYRIIETIKKIGIDSVGITDPRIHDIGFIFSGSKVFEFENEEEEEKQSGKEKIRDVGDITYSKNYKSKRYIVFGTLILTVVGACTLCACISYCYTIAWKHRTTKKSGGQVKISTETSSRSIPIAGKNEKLLTFHFFVNFFKKKNENSISSLNKKQKIDNISSKVKERNESVKADHDKFVSSNEIETPEPIRTRLVVDKRTEKENEDSTHFNLSSYKLPKQHFNPIVASIWPYHTSFGPFEKIPVVDTPEKLEKNLSFNTKNFKKTKNQVKTIWVKPSKRFGKGIHTKNIKRSKLKARNGCTSCDYSESCCNTCNTPTKSSSETQGASENSESEKDYSDSSLSEST